MWERRGEKKRRRKPQGKLPTIVRDELKTGTSGMGTIGCGVAGMR
jgi:hypothetical protein